MLFVAARPRDDAEFDALRQEAVAHGDMSVVQHVWEHYDNITYQTLEACRAAALDPTITHMLKVAPPHTHHHHHHHYNPHVTLWRSMCECVEAVC